MLLRFCRNLDDMEDLLRTGGRTIRLRLMSSATCSPNGARRRIFNDAGVGWDKVDDHEGAQG
jgi:hypothetical protein